MSAADIVDVVKEFVTLRKAGVNYKGLCPFHNEKTPSFVVSPSKQLCKCFSCGKGGNVVHFVMEHEQMNYPEALRWLAKKYGIEIQEKELTNEERAAQSVRESMFVLNEWANKYFEETLHNHVDGVAIGMAYFRQRGLRDDIIRKFHLGYSLPVRDALAKAALAKGFSEEMLEKTGLCYRTDEGRLLDRYHARVIFPVQTVSGMTVAFGGRTLSADKKVAKYVNSPESEIYSKSHELYGLYLAKHAIVKQNRCYLVEGYMDVISMHQAGFTQAVASLGTAFTVEQANLLHRYAENILLAYDSDGAGTKAALRGIGILREAGLTGKVINMRPYKDPDEFIKNLGKEAFQERIDQAENSFYFEIRILSEQYDQSDPEQRTKFHREIAQKLCEFSEDLERENYLQAIAEKYMIRPDDLRKMVVGIASQTGLARPLERPRSGVQKKDPAENGRRSQRLLITWISDDPSLYRIVRKYISPEDFTEELYRKVAERLFDELDRDQFQPAGIISMFEDEEEQREAAELFHTTLPELSTRQERERAFHDILLAVKKNSYQYYMAKLGTDVNAVKQAVEGKKALEELQRTHISLE